MYGEHLPFADGGSRAEGGAEASQNQVVYRAISGTLGQGWGVYVRKQPAGAR